MNIISPLHLFLAVYSVFAGAIILRNRKGTVLHTWLGRSFVAAMILTDVTAFLFIPKYGFTWFIALAVLNLTYILIGLWYALKRPGKLWVVHHFYYFSYAYLGVLAAAFGRVPLILTSSIDFAALISIALVFGIGIPLIERTGKKLRLVIANSAT